MIVRQLKKSDIPRLEEIHGKSGVPLPFPDVENEFFPIPVVVDENNRVVAAVGSVPAAEIWFWIDHKWENPGMRMEALSRLHEVVRQDLLTRGIILVNASVPPKIAKSFGKKLIDIFKWIKSDWVHFSRRTDNG